MILTTAAFSSGFSCIFLDRRGTMQLRLMVVSNILIHPTKKEHLITNIHSSQKYLKGTIIIVKVLTQMVEIERLSNHPCSLYLYLVRY